MLGLIFLIKFYVHFINIIIRIFFRNFNQFPNIVESRENSYMGISTLGFCLLKIEDQNPIYLVQFVHSSLFWRQHLYKFSEPSCFCSRCPLPSERNVWVRRDLLKKNFFSFKDIQMRLNIKIEITSLKKPLTSYGEFFNYRSTL